MAEKNKIYFIYIILLVPFCYPYGDLFIDMKCARIFLINREGERESLQRSNFCNVYLIFHISLTKHIVSLFEYIA